MMYLHNVQLKAMYVIGLNTFSFKERTFYCSVNYNTYVDSHNYQHYQNKEQLHHLKTSLVLSLYSHTLPLATTDLFFIGIDLYFWKCLINDIIQYIIFWDWLLSFCMSEIHPSRCMYPCNSSFLFFYCTDAPHDQRTFNVVFVTFVVAVIFIIPSLSLVFSWWLRIWQSHFSSWLSAVLLTALCKIVRQKTKT